MIREIINYIGFGGLYLFLFFLAIYLGFILSPKILKKFWDKKKAEIEQMSDTPESTEPIKEKMPFSKRFALNSIKNIMKSNNLTIEDIQNDTDK